MTHYLGDTITDAFILRDDANAAIIGKVAANFTAISAFLTTTPATTAAVTLAEIGTGMYRISFLPSLVGHWSARVIYTTPTASIREYLGDYDIDAVVTGGSAPSVSISGGGGSSTVIAVATALVNIGTLRRGDSYTLTLALLNEGGAPLDLTGGYVRFAPKKLRANTDTSIMDKFWVSGGTSLGITVASPTNGSIVVKLAPADTEALWVTSAADPVTVPYEIQVAYAATGAVRTPVIGTITVISDLATGTTPPV